VPEVLDKEVEQIFR